MTLSPNGPKSPNSPNGLYGLKSPNSPIDLHESGGLGAMKALAGPGPAVSGHAQTIAPRPGGPLRTLTGLPLQSGD